MENILFSVACIGENNDKSVTRLAFSDEYFCAVEKVSKMMKEIGLNVHVDSVGNICGRLEVNPKFKTIMLGSHLDTVIEGGKYDGVYGVIAAIEAVRGLPRGKLLHNIEVWGFNAEESGPFGGTFGSRAVCGLVCENQNGLSEALSKYGKNFKDVLGARRNFDDVLCYLELHVEQGDYLYSQNKQIGAVSAITGIRRYNITSIGESNHAGTTMMKTRHDALVAMSRLISRSDDVARALDDTLVLTPGKISVTPGMESVITSSATVCFEMRHVNTEVLDKLFENMLYITNDINEVEWKFEKLIDKPSIKCSEDIIDLTVSVCKKMNISHCIMPSGAGHDANPFAYKVPVGMVFVPSEKGISHSLHEYTKPEHLNMGRDILRELLLHIK